MEPTTIKTTVSFELHTRTGRELTLTFTYPTLAVVKEVLRMRKDGKILEANEVLFASCLPENQRHLIQDADIFLALNSAENPGDETVFDVLIKTGYSVFLNG